MQGPPFLTSYDVIVVNTSAGKDSQTMMGLIVDQAAELGVLDRVVAVHADLGRVEWDGTVELAERQAAFYGLRFIKIARPQGDLLSHIESRGMFPSSTTRYCTSDHKRGQVAKVLTQLVSERRNTAGYVRDPVLGTYAKRKVRILNCMGFRAEESPARAKKQPFGNDQRATNTKRHVDFWYPILAWTLDEVWADIARRGVESHPAYAAGMPRLSCCFCVLASKGALIRAVQLKPELAQEYLAVEVKIGHRFTQALSMAEIIEAASEGEAAPIDDWAA